jgi:tetratricopeptide (TPR) repeat protein
VGGHWNAFGNGFVFDDLLIIRDNSAIQELGRVPALFTQDYWGAWGGQGLYRPLVLTSYAVNYGLGGLATPGYTAVNLALHGAVSVLVLALATSLGAAWPVAAAAGLLYAVHPVHTEAVTGIVGRAETLSALFLFLAFLGHRRGPAARRPALIRGLTAVAYLLALLSKENAFTFLGLVVLGEAFFPVTGRDGTSFSPRRRVRDYLLLLGLTIAFLGIRGAIVGFGSPPATPLNNPLLPIIGPTPLGNVYGADFLTARMTAIAVLGTYARLLLWPATLSCDYSLAALPLVHSPADPRFLAGLAALLAVLGGTVFLRRRARLVAFGLGFLAVSFVLSSNLLIRIGTICAERLLYLPSAGFVLATAAGLGLLWERPRLAPWATVFLLLAVMGGAARTWIRNRDWRDEHALWASAVRIVPASAKAQTEYGRVLLDESEGASARGQADSAATLRHRASRHLDQALAIYPECRPAANHRTRVAILDGDLARAQELCERAVRVDSTDAMAYSNWGYVLKQEGERAAAGTPEAQRSFAEALAKLDRAVALDSTLVNARLNRGALYRYRLGRPDLALPDFHAVLRLAPNHPNTTALKRETLRIESSGRRAESSAFHGGK